MSLDAQVRSSDLGDDPGNNLASVTGSIENLSGNLVLSLLSAPAALTAPSEFSVRLRVTNSADGPVFQGQLRLERSPGLELLSASPGTILTECCGPEDFTETVLLNPLPAKSSTDLDLRYRIALPGVFHLGAGLGATVTHNGPADDRLSLVLSAPPIQKTPGLAQIEFPPGAFAWLDAKEELLAVFRGHPALVVLDPDNLEVRRQVSLSGNPSSNRARLAVAADGRRAWALTDRDQIVQLHLPAGTVEAQFPNPLTPPSFLLPNAGLAFATVPSQPEMLLIAGVTEPMETQILALHKGAVLPTRHRYASFQHGANPAMHVTDDGRLFVLAENQLAEFEVSESGVSEKRRIANLTDRLGPLSSAGSRLVVSGGPAFDLGSFQPIPPTPPDLRWVGVPELSLVFRYPTAGILRDNLNNRFIETIEPETFEVLRRREVRADDWPMGDIVQEVSLGRHGLLLLGTPALRVVNEAPDDVPDADLSVTVDATTIVATVGEPVTLPLVVSHTGSRTSRNTLLEVTLPPDVELVEASVPFTNRNTVRTFTLGHLARTNLKASLVLKASHLGTQPLQFRVFSDTTDPNSANNMAAATLPIFPAPEVIIRDAVVSEGSDATRPPYYPVYLSHPSPKRIEIPFRVVPITASASDLTFTEGVATFAPGVTVAAAYFIRPNTQRDPDRTVRLELGDTPIPAQRRTSLVTIVDDETPAISVRAGSVPEGQSGIQWGLFNIDLRNAPASPLDIAYRLDPGTATADEDFRADAGWIRFEPGQTNRTLAVAILGDTRFEAAETVRLVLTDTAGLEWDGSIGPLTMTNDDKPEPPVIEFVQVGTRLRLTFGSVPGARYRVQSNNRLGSVGWAFESGILNGTGQPLTWTVPLPTFGSFPFFYRIRVD
ncbi:MAG: hypothetical protein JNK85_04220 [Verrucomicrobiales bacterium]|nr:hypothetical protein [Verrucomicrobiales bacterium]